MFQLVEDKADISECQRQLERMISNALSQKLRRDIGFPGETIRNANIQTDGQYWFHTRDQHEGTPRRLNWFGSTKAKGNLHITVEINTPYEGRVGQTSGYFVRDTETGQRFLAHSGRVGGGTAGVGKDEYLTWTELKLTEARCSDGAVKRGIIVAPLDNPRGGMTRLMYYIDTVARFKIAARAGETQTKAFKDKVSKFKDFYSEAGGRRRGWRSAEIDYITRHNEIVDALHAWRSLQPKPARSRIVKSVAIDLGLSVGADLTEVYEAKPSADRASVYKAIGQVLVHGASPSCRRVLVLPAAEPLKRELAAALRRLNIEVLRFRLLRKGAEIVGDD